MIRIATQSTYRYLNLLLTTNSRGIRVLSMSETAIYISYAWVTRAQAITTGGTVERIIVNVSGGLASAWCLRWAQREFPREQVTAYFNDTRWEHPDLYRFLGDLEVLFGLKILRDSDGRTPAEVFTDEHLLANNRAPICSRILKAERLQSFAQEGDVLLFGIGPEEEHRAAKIRDVYQEVEERRSISLTCRFPLIETKTDKATVRRWFDATGIALPELYRLGFPHNNCGGGCVRAGVGQWAHLLRVQPETYAARENPLQSFRVRFGWDVHFLKTITLRALRERIERQPELSFEIGEAPECIGICGSIA